MTKHPFIWSKWALNNTYSLATQSLAFEAEKYFTVVILETEMAISRKTNEYSFQLKVLFLPNFFFLVDNILYGQNENE